MLTAAVLALGGCATSKPTAGKSSARADQGARAERTARTPARTTESDAKVPREIRRSFDLALQDLRAERYSDAEAALAKLTVSEPNLAGPHANLGLVYLRTDRIEEAEKAIRRAIGLNGNNPALYNYLGMVQRHGGRFEEARQSYQKALELDPDFAPAHANLGILLDLYLQDPSGALEHYERYQALQGGNDKEAAMWIADLRKRAPAAGAAPTRANADRKEVPQ